MYTHFNILLKFNAFRFVRFFFIFIARTFKASNFRHFQSFQTGVLWCGVIQLHTLPLISQIDFNYNVFLSRPFYFLSIFPSVSTVESTRDCLIAKTHTQTKTKVEKKNS